VQAFPFGTLQLQVRIATVEERQLLDHRTPDLNRGDCIS